MKVPRALLTVAVLAGGSEVGAQATGPPPAWQFKPSLYALGSIDESSELPFGNSDIATGEDSPAANLGLGLDFDRQTSESRLRGSLFALTRSPFDGGGRSLFGAGRVEAARRFGQGGRLTFTDGFKVQLQPQLKVSDYWGNAAILRAEWTRPSGRGFGLQIGDRRRTLPDLDLLSFSRQSGGLRIFFPVSAHGRAEAGVEVQHYSATTASGERLVVGGEVAAFGGPGILTLRLAWFEPMSDRRRVDSTAGEPDEQAEFGDIGRAEFFEILALQGGYGAVLGDAFFLDPLQSDSDEWDFGRRKLVLTSFLSRRVAERTTASAFLRLQHKRGPNLLLPEGAPGAESFGDDRVEVRGSLRYQIRRRVSLVLQGSYVKNWSNRPTLDFYRVLGAFGVQIEF
jgi:hypothetical protein